MSRKWSFFPSLALLLAVVGGLSTLTAWKHYEGLPEPVLERTHAESNVPQISETEILKHALVLSEDIGFRTVGTREHALGDAWMLEQALEIKKLCEAAVEVESGRNLECEVDRQSGSGSHRFDILGKRLYKTYVNLSNIVIRISDGTPAGKEHAVLVNSHLDSTLPSPGAADDALSVGVMIEAARTLIATPSWSPKHAIILLFNNAEESLQDGSHLFGTQHPWRDSVRAVLNLEAAGTKGHTLLFQATSEQMIDAYSLVPYPFGTIVAHDIFSSGIMGSDTDFRQFQLYMNVTGLDMAVVGHSYFYHTRKDLVKYIDPGVAQHMADNTLVLLRHLSSSESPLAELTSGYTKPKTVFLSVLNRKFLRYGFETANGLHFALLAASLALIAITSPFSVTVMRAREEKILVTGDAVIEEQEVAEEIISSSDTWPSLWRAVVVLGATFIGAVLGANIVAIVMVRLGRSMSWYSSEASCALLYGPAALCFGLGTYLLASPIWPSSERKLYHATLFCYTLLATVLQLAGIGSAVLFSAAGLSMFLGLAYDSVRKSKDSIALGAYVIGQVIPAFFGSEMFAVVTEIFVPLTGRMGAEAPAENIIASTTVMLLTYLAPLLLPFLARFGRQIVARAFYVTLAVTVVAIAAFSMRMPFDAMHPKRLYIIHSENITTNEVSLGVGTSDTAPGFTDLVQGISGFVTQNKTEAVKADMHAYNGDWDTLYPFSSFLSPYDIELDPYVSAYSDGRFRIETANDHINKEAGTRSLTLVVHHPGLIWTTIAFDAHVLKWSFDNSPPDVYTRHFVKEASFYGESKWSVDLTIKLPHTSSPSPTSEESGLRVNFVGVKEKVMWPGKRAETREGRDGELMALFERLDGWLEEKTQGSVDLTVFGSVGGVTVV